MGRRNQKGSSPDGRCRDKSILAEEGTSCTDNRDVTLSSADALTALMHYHHARAATSVDRHARALQVKEVRDAVSNHSSASACKEGMRKDLGIFGLDLMVIFIECTGVYRGISASKCFDGDTSFFSRLVDALWGGRGLNVRTRGLAIFGSFIDSLQQKPGLRIQSLKETVSCLTNKVPNKAFSEAQEDLTYTGQVRRKIEERSIEQGDVLAHEIATFNMALNSSPLVNCTRASSMMPRSETYPSGSGIVLVIQ